MRCSHLWFSRGFTRPPGPRLATTPSEPTTSKPCRPQGLCTRHMIRAGSDRTVARVRGCRRFDVVVIGAGPAGEVAAGRLAGRRAEGRDRRGPAGRRRVLVLGVHAVEGAAASLRGAGGGAPHPGRRRGGHRQRSTSRRCSSAATRSSTTSTTRSMLPWLEDRGIALFRGRGRLTGERRVTVELNDGGTEELEAATAVILAGGTLPAMPPIEGLDTIDDTWTNREATTAQDDPRAAGDHGRRRGRRRDVPGVQHARREGHADRGRAQAAPAEEEFACEQVTEALESQGVDIRRGRKAERVERDGGGVRSRSTTAATVEGDTLLVAVGRTPQTQQLGLEDLGFEAGELRRGRRALPGPGPRLALRDRRPQRPGAVHPHGQVPGAHRRPTTSLGRDTRRPARRRRPALARA